MLSSDLPNLKSIATRYVDNATIRLRDQILQKTADIVTNSIDDFINQTEYAYQQELDEVRDLAEKRRDHFQQWLKDHRKSMGVWRASWEEVILHMISVVTWQENTLIEELRKTRERSIAYNRKLEERLIFESQEQRQQQMESTRRKMLDAIQDADRIVDVMDYITEFQHASSEMSEEVVDVGGDGATSQRQSHKKNLATIRTTLTFSEERTLLKQYATSKKWQGVEALLDFYQHGPPLKRTL